MAFDRFVESFEFSGAGKVGRIESPGVAQPVCTIMTRVDLEGEPMVCAVAFGRLPIKRSSLVKQTIPERTSMAFSIAERLIASAVEAIAAEEGVHAKQSVPEVLELRRDRNQAMLATVQRLLEKRATGGEHVTLVNYEFDNEDGDRIPITLICLQLRAGTA